MTENDIDGLKNMGKIAAKAPPVAEPAPAAKRPAKRRKVASRPPAGGQETDHLKQELEKQKMLAEQLKKEKEMMQSKSRNLALIIERLSSKAGQQQQQPLPQQVPDVSPKLRELEDKVSGQIKELAESFAKKGKEEAENEEKKKRGREDLVDSINKTLEKRMRDIDDKIAARLEPKVSVPTTAPAVELSKGLAAFEGGVSLKRETEDLKDGLGKLERRFDEKVDDMNSRFLNVERQFKRIEKIPEIEERVENIFSKLGPENIERMRKLVYDASEIAEEVIPHEIKKNLISRVGPVFTDVRELKKSVAFMSSRFKTLSEELSAIRKEMKAIEKLKVDLTDIEAQKEKLITEMREEDNKSVDRVEEIREKFRAVISGIYKDIDDHKKAVEKMVEESVEKKMTRYVRAETDQVEHRLTLVMTTMKERMEYLKSEIGELHKKLEQLPEMKMDMRSIEKSIEKLYGWQSDAEAAAKELRLEDKKLRTMIEGLETPSEIMNQLSKKSADAEDIKDFIIKRTNALNQRIDEIAEKSAPDRALFSAVEKASGKIEALEKGMAELEKENEANTARISQLLSQGAEERKRFEERLAAQKKKFGSLLREVRD